MVKSLKDQISELNEKIKDMEETIFQAELMLKQEKDKKKKLEEQVNMKRQPVRVSDHGIVRYLERVKGMDISAIRDEMLTPERIDAIENGATRIIIGGHKFVVQNKTIVTVLD